MLVYTLNLAKELHLVLVLIGYCFEGSGITAIDRVLMAVFPGVASCRDSLTVVRVSLIISSDVIRSLHENTVSSSSSDSFIPLKHSFSYS